MSRLLQRMKYDPLGLANLSMAIACLSVSAPSVAQEVTAASLPDVIGPVEAGIAPDYRGIDHSVNSGQRYSVLDDQTVQIDACGVGCFDWAPHDSLLSKVGPDGLASASFQATKHLALYNRIAQVEEESVDLAPESTRAVTDVEVREINDEIEDFLDIVGEVDNNQPSPGITLSNPSGYGADAWTVFANYNYQSKVRRASEDDAVAALGFGVGDSRDAVGFELSYTFASFGGNRSPGTGGFNAKVHRQFPERFGVAVGWEGFANIGDDNDFRDTVYGSISKIITVRPNVRSPFSRIAVTGGFGTGRFRSERDFVDGKDSVSPFGSLAILLIPRVTTILEWTGQDLATGLSVAPFPKVPIVITPHVRDIVGAGDGPRFVLSTGISWTF